MLVPLPLVVLSKSAQEVDRTRIRGIDCSVYWKAADTARETKICVTRRTENNITPVQEATELFQRNRLDLKVVERVLLDIRASGKWSFEERDAGRGRHDVVWCRGDLCVKWSVEAVSAKARRARVMEGLKRWQIEEKKEK